LTDTWAAPPQPPSLTPQPSILDGPEPYFNTVSVAYDDVAGTVTGSFVLYDPAYWAQNMDTYGSGSGSGIQIDLSTSCMDQYQMPAVMWPVGGAPSAWPGEDLTFTLAPDSFSNDAFDVESSLTGYESAVTGSGSFDSTTYSGTVQSPYFVGQNFRCASISLINTATNTDPENAGPDYGSDNGWQWLDGYAPPPPPPPPPLPKLLMSFTSSQPYAVRPRFIALSVDGSGFISGPRIKGHITWTSWTQTSATGRGDEWQDNCIPNCAEGHYSSWAVKLHAYRPRNGRFTRLTIQGRPHDGWRTHTYRLIQSGGVGYWT